MIFSSWLMSINPPSYASSACTSASIVDVRVEDKELLQELFTASCDKIKQQLPDETAHMDCDTDVYEAVIKRPKVSEMVADEDL